jgi:putative phosphoesterase
MKIGVLSDTHGLLRSEVLIALAGSDHILHSGDVGQPAIGHSDILEALRQIAPVTAIRGNVDTHGPCAQLPATEAIELAGRLFYLVHSERWLDIHPHAAGIAAVISGHSHQPGIDTRHGVLYLNPGSAGPRRFKLPVTVATIEVTGNQLTPKIIEICPRV